ALLLYVLLSWVAPGTYSPASALVSSLCEPLLAPVRRVIPPLGGIDFSAAFVIIALWALYIAINEYLLTPPGYCTRRARRIVLPGPSLDGRKRRCHQLHGLLRRSWVAPRWQAAATSARSTRYRRRSPPRIPSATSAATRCTTTRCAPTR